MLEIVEHEEHLSVMQKIQNPFERRLVFTFANAERQRDRRQNEIGSANRSERNESCPIGETWSKTRGDLQSEAGLANPTRTGQRYQPHVFTLQ